MWRELIDSVEAQAAFSPAATDEMIQQAERRLGLAFPDELRRLLAETDGVERQDGLGVIWPVERIVADNLRFRTIERNS